MKKLLFAAVVFLSLSIIFAAEARASTTYMDFNNMGHMGFSGGISEGRRLPRTTETILLRAGGTRGGAANQGNVITMQYREYVFLTGEALLFEGLLEVRMGRPAPGSTEGTFQAQYRVFPGAVLGDVVINRIKNFTVEYRRVGNQMIYTFIINNNTWRETILTPAGTFTLDWNRSSFITSVFEDRTPAINFYRGDVSARMFYTLGVGEDAAVTTVEQVGEFYGFSSAWSATETHRMSFSIVNDSWGLMYEIRPSVSVNKDLQFVHNEPTMISFFGNYREQHQSFAGLRYNIYVQPHEFWDQPQVGYTNMTIFNVFEQLPAPDLSFLHGHSAQDDIHRLFAMEILTGDPRHFVPNQAMTRGQFLTALARAIKLPVYEPIVPLGAAGAQPVALTLFADVSTNRPEFRYIEAIQRNGIAFGRESGMFYFDSPISRQEAIVTIIRSLGLINMSLNPTVASPFHDSDQIANWAMRYVDVALQLRIIGPDDAGNFHPRRAISKAEAAALLNSLISFMRNEIVDHYGAQIVNITAP